jgi:hypothetical protein
MVDYANTDDALAVAEGVIEDVRRIARIIDPAVAEPSFAGSARRLVARSMGAEVVLTGEQLEEIAAVEGRLHEAGRTIARLRGHGEAVNEGVGTADERGSTRMGGGPAGEDGVHYVGGLPCREVPGGWEWRAEDAVGDRNLLLDDIEKLRARLAVERRLASALAGALSEYCDAV